MRHGSLGFLVGGKGGLIHPGAELGRRMVVFLAREDEAMQDYQAETARHLPYKNM